MIINVTTTRCDVMRANNIPVMDWVILHRSEIERDIEAAIRKIEALGASDDASRTGVAGQTV